MINFLIYLVCSISFFYLFIHFLSKKLKITYYVYEKKKGGVVMRANRHQKQNPNPPWPSEQAVVVVPPGSGAAAIGKVNAETRVMPANVQFATAQNISNSTPFERSEGMPIMGYAGNSREETGKSLQGIINSKGTELMELFKKGYLGR